MLTYGGAEHFSIQYNFYFNSFGLL